MRVLVAGTGGAGKTTMCGVLARAWDLRRVELDALHHGPNWVPRAEFEDDVRAFVARHPRWVTEFQYTSKLGTLLIDHADLVVWLDYPKRTVMRQVIVRTVRRRLARQELWNGNTEAPLHTVFTDRDHIIRWAWQMHPRQKERIESLLAHRDLPVVRLRGARQRNAWARRNLTRMDGPR